MEEAVQGELQRKDSEGGGWCVEKMGCGVLSSVWGGLCRGRMVHGEDSAGTKLCLEPSVVHGDVGRLVQGEGSA